MMQRAVILILCSLTFNLQAQYHAPAEQFGTHAIHMDSSIIRDWATSCVLQRGWRNILDTTLGKTTVGDENSPLGKALKNGVVSLGDGGRATLSFGGKIYNGPGPDFAVFENGFDEYFLELAFVEVSSDGDHFFRFPAHSLTSDTVQVGSFDSLYATKLNNLAGKYQQGYGVPFDLEEMKGIPGLDVDYISHIRVVDVVGTINPKFGSFDKDSNLVNDPFPTPYISGGFDLDGVGVIYLRPTSLDKQRISKLKVYPNPASHQINFDSTISPDQIEIYSFCGSKLDVVFNSNSSLNIEFLPKGVYILKLRFEQQWYSAQFIKQ